MDMNIIAQEDPIVVLMLGFCIAMVVFVTLLLLARNGRPSYIEYVPTPVAYPISDGGEGGRAVYLIIPLIIIIIMILSS
jgi:hypothetical protein